MTQQELGSRLGVPQTTVSRWERGTVDYGIEQLRTIEDSLGLRHGALLVAGGYVVGDEMPWPILRTATFTSFDLALEHLRAAERLDLGVRLTNRWESDEISGDRVLVWTLVTSSEAPGSEG
jgi:transcriptional regulator with XRE-family HTH domain